MDVKKWISEYPYLQAETSCIQNPRIVLFFLPLAILNNSRAKQHQSYLYLRNKLFVLKHLSYLFFITN